MAKKLNTDEFTFTGIPRGNEYAVPLSRVAGNVMWVKDGSVWVNYLITGVNVNPYSPGMVSSAQSLNDELITSLCGIDAPEFLIVGIKNAERPQDVMSQCLRGVEGVTRDAFPELYLQLDELHRRIKSGELASFERLFWLSVPMPFNRSIKDRLAGRILETDPHADVGGKEVQEFNRAVGLAIPEQFKPRRTTPEHLRWLMERATSRGVFVPFERKCGGDAKMKFNVKSFPAYSFDTAAESSALYESFVEDIADRLNEKGTAALSSLKKSRLRESFFGTFRAIHKSKVMAISAVETGNKDFPDGYTSFQSMLGISAPPSENSTAVNSFTYIVDQAIGVDADFALRFRHAPDVISKNTASEVLGDLKSEDAANSKDELDADEYADAIENVFNLRDAVRAESNPIGLKVTALFAFGHMDLNELKRRTAALTKNFATNGFTTYQAPAGQFDMWQQMMPGVRRSRLTEDLSMDTTSYLFSGCMPIRKTIAGDTQGLPLAQNTENALGQLVLWDVLNSTDKGNASIIVSGAQGSGKSHLIKMMLGYMIDLKRYVYLIDQHKHGEYEVYASTLTDTEVFSVTGRTGSLDPFKLYEDHALAERVFMDLWLPLLNIEIDSPMASILSRMVKLEYRKPRGLTTTRKLIDYIVARGTENASTELASKFEIWGEQSYCSALIDPVEYGNVVDLPAFDSTKRCVVFRTHELSVYRGNNIAEASPSERYTAVIYNAIARYAAYQFSRVEGACAFIGDELHFLDGNDRVLDTLIRTPDRTGRKDGNFVIGGSQLAGDFGSQYDMIKRKFAMRQETEPNAREALEWVGTPVTDFLTDRMLNDTSPPDPDDNNRPTKGREGEGWYNDGNGNIIRVKVLDHMRDDRRRMSDTTSSRMIRAENLPAIKS